MRAENLSNDGGNKGMNAFETASERERKRLDLAEIDNADELQSHMKLIVSLFGSLASGTRGTRRLRRLLSHSGYIRLFSPPGFAGVLRQFGSVGKDQCEQMGMFLRLHITVGHIIKCTICISPTVFQYI